MKKIMFNDKYGLTKAVLEGRKTMTRRIAFSGDVKSPKYGFMTEGTEAGKLALCDKNFIVAKSSYKLGEVVAVAQSYKDIGLYFIYPPDKQWGVTEDMSGYRNKMFVRADLMPHQIRITDVRVERMQDISDQDCLREGVQEAGLHSYYVHSQNDILGLSAKGVFSILIDKISENGTWDSNPWVFVYEFELVK